MNPIIINSVPCPVCEAPVGVPCTRNGESGCGMRLDDFMREGSFEDRLAIHLETEAYFAEHYPEFLGSPSTFVSEEELERAKKLGLVPDFKKK